MTASLSAVTDRDPLSYGVGDPIRFEFAVSGAPRDSRIRWRRTGDDGVVEEGEKTFAIRQSAADSRQATGDIRHSATDSRQATGAIRHSATDIRQATGDIRHSAAGVLPQGRARSAALAAIVAKGLSRPGFLRLDADLVSPGGATLASFSGGAGADVAAIRADTPEPPDFDAFWARRKEALAAVPARGATCREIASPRADVRLFCVEIPCPGAHPSTGILSVPSSGGPFPAKLRLRGYEASWSEIARTTPQPEELSATEIVFFLSAHGFEFNREPEYYAKFRAESGSGGWDVAFDPVQNSDPGESYFGGIAWRVLRGLEWLETRPEWDGQSLVVFGGSLGGWQSIVAAAFDRNVTECRPRIPWCCNMAGPAAGRAHGDWFVPWVPELAYYDPVNMARRIPAACRVEIPQAGLGDRISPPFGIMAFYNALPCPKSATFVQGATHFDFPAAPRQTSFLKAAKSVLAAVLVLAATRPASGAETESFEWKAMGTRIRLVVRGEGAATAGPAMAAAASNALEAVEAQTSAFRAEAPLARLRETAGSGEWTAVGEPFETALDLALGAARESGGAFNPLVAPLLEAHGFARRPPGATPPDSTETPPATLLDLSKIERRPGVCRLDAGGMALDLGGLAKGLGADRAAEAACKAGAADFLLDAGGTIVGRGSWTVGLRDPRAGPDAPPLRAFVLADGMACATSGNYERFVENPDGSVVGHIFDPRAAQPVRSGVLQTTVFAPTAADADAWSTALFVLGPSDGRAALASHPGLAAVWVISAPGGSVRILSAPGAGTPRPPPAGF